MHDEKQLFEYCLSRNYFTHTNLTWCMVFKCIVISSQSNNEETIDYMVLLDHLYRFTGVHAYTMYVHVCITITFITRM